MNKQTVSVFLFTSTVFTFGANPDGRSVGRPVAEFIRAQMTSIGFSVESLVEATEGWELNTCISGQRFLLFIHWAPIGNEAINYWVIQIRKPWSFKKFFKMAEEDVTIAVQGVSKAITQRNEIQDGRWVTDAEFRALY
jgi:hypothetical protein